MSLRVELNLLRWRPSGTSIILVLRRTVCSKALLECFKNVSQETVTVGNDSKAGTIKREKELGPLLAGEVGSRTDLLYVTWQHNLSMQLRCTKERKTYGERKTGELLV